MNSKSRERSGNWFFIADPHINHSNIIKYCKRPFLSELEQDLMKMADNGVIPSSDIKISAETTDKMSNTILDSINAVVSKDDNLVIAGDVAFAPKQEFENKLREIKERIICQNIVIILGNHDNEDLLRKVFNRPGDAVYEQHLFNIKGQMIFVNHYPMRSWDCSHHEAYCLYGHVHNLFWPEDNGQLMSYDKKVFSEGFTEVLKKHKLTYQDKIITDLLDVVASTKGIDLTLDIGVDNVREGIPFGTPWSMSEIHAYMNKKRPKWKKRKEEFRKLASLSSLK